MRETSQLAEVLQMEAELAETLVEALEQKQEAIVHLRGGDLSEAVAREEQIIGPMKKLEGERLRLTRKIVGALPRTSSERDQRQPNLDDLLKRFDGTEASSVSELASRLRTAVRRILNMNEQNRIFLEHSRRFVRETLRILTDDHRQKLVDQKM